VYKAAKAADQVARNAAAAKPQGRQGSEQRRDKEIEDMRQQLKAFQEDAVRRAKERKEEEADGFTVAKTRAQARKDKKAAKNVASTPAPATGGKRAATVTAGITPSTVAAIRIVEVNDNDVDEHMDDDTTSSEETVKDKIERLSKLVKGLEALQDASPDDGVLATLITRKQELEDANDMLKTEVAAATPGWKTTKALGLKRTRKRQAKDKVQAQRDLLQEALAEWRADKEREEKAKVEEIKAVQVKLDELVAEVAALDREYEEKEERLKLGKNGGVIQDLTQSLLDCAVDPPHEVVLACKSAQALISSASSVAAARVAAANAAGVALAPRDEAVTPEEARVHAIVLELTRQLTNNADSFITGQKTMEEQRANSLRHLASLQATRTTEPLVRLSSASPDGVHPGGGNDGELPAPDTSKADSSGKQAGVTDPAAVAVALAGEAGKQAEALAAAAVPVPGDM